MQKQLQLWLWLVVGCTFFSSLAGCYSVMAAIHYNYSVDVINESGEAILVEPFKVFEKGPYNMTSGGFFAPRATKSTLSYRYAPSEIVTIKWKSIATEKTSQATVKLQLPKEFTKKNGSDIYFHIKQDQSVQVAYRVMDAKGNFTMFE